MLIYNVTTKITWQIHDSWVQWMKEEHVPAIMATGSFSGSRFVRLLETDEEDGPTYAAQFFAERREDYDNYLEHHATQLRNNAATKWGNQFISFRSLMQLVN